MKTQNENDIWKDAPEDATHFCEIKKAWMKRSDHGNWLEWGQFGRAKGEPLIGWCFCHAPNHATTLVRKAWEGTGLPQAGTICEANVPEIVHRIAGVTGYAWRRVEVCKSGIPGAEGECLVFDLETTVPCWADEFRPIRTPEQIAAEERQKAIAEMQRAVGSLNREPFATLYDLGFCRKKGGDV